jgi:hypothetical protein
VVVGVRLDGQKELVAIADGYRESTNSWATAKESAPPGRASRSSWSLGVLEFWATLREVFPETKEQR